MQLRQGCRQFWLVLPVLAIDRASKLAVLKLLVHGPKEAIPGVLSWAFVKNRGAAFGMMSGSWLLPLLTAALIALLLIWLLRHPDESALMRASIWLIIGGGLGNLYDRIAYGFVVDFIRLDFINFAVFNAADVFICAGAALAAIAVLAAEARRTKHG